MIWSSVGIYALVGFSVIISLIWRREKVRACYFVFTYTIFTWFITVMKVAYEEARPFWVNEEILALKCADGYGNPAGHAITGVGFSMLILLDSLSESNADSNTKYYVLTLLYGASLSISCILLGVNTYNQVFFGSQIGLWLAFSCHYLLRDALVDHLNKLFSLSDTQY